MRIFTRDGSRHVMCPACKRRTKLYKLQDRRRKCTTCGKKFTIDRSQDRQRLEKYAVLLVCFCLDFTAHRVATITGFRYQFVARVYAYFRTLIAQQTAPLEALQKMMDMHQMETLYRISRCAPCRKLLRNGKPVLVIGVRYASKKILLESLATKAPETFAATYGGFICHSTFHRFTHSAGKTGDGLELFWAWVEEHMRPYHGVFSQNIVLYLKELEWKYNHRHLKPHMQAMRLMLLLPLNFLET